MANFGRLLKDRVLGVFGGKNTAYTNTIGIGGDSQPVDNSATWNYGFPSKTMLPVDTTNPTQGGIPPNGKDMNGVLNSISAECYNSMNGILPNEWIAPSVWRSVDPSWSGYPSGAIVLYPTGNVSDSTKKKFYQSTKNNNLETPSISSNAWINVQPIVNPFDVFPNYGNVLNIFNDAGAITNLNYNYVLPDHWGWVWASTHIDEWYRSSITINGCDFSIGGGSNDEGTGTGSFFLPVPPKSIINRCVSIGTIRFYYSYGN